MRQWHTSLCHRRSACREKRWLCNIDHEGKLANLICGLGEGKGPGRGRPNSADQTLLIGRVGRELGEDVRGRWRAVLLAG